MNIEEYRAVWHKYFHIPDDTRLDVPLAVYLSREMKGTPLWLIIVSNSGDMKTEQLLSLEDDGILFDEKTGLEQCKIRKEDEDLETKTMHRFTSKTLVSGYINAEDLAPKLKNKVLLFLDFAELLNLHPAEKIQVWSQLRNLYDGRAGSQSRLPGGRTALRPAATVGGRAGARGRAETAHARRTGSRPHPT